MSAYPSNLHRSLVPAINGVPCFVVGGRHAIAGAQEPEVIERLLDVAAVEAAFEAAFDWARPARRPIRRNHTRFVTITIRCTGLYDAFGPDRFFWGTDITRMPCSYRQCVRLFTEELPWLAGAELAQGLCYWIG